MRSNNTKKKSESGHRADMTLEEFNQSGIDFGPEVIRKNFGRSKKVTVLHFVVMTISRNKSLLQWHPKLNNCFIVKNSGQLSKLWALVNYCIAMEKIGKSDRNFDRERNRARFMDYEKFSRAARNYSNHYALCLSTKTGSGKGSQKEWGFSNQFLHLVDYSKGGDDSLYDCVLKKADRCGILARPLLKQVHKGLEIDHVLALRSRQPFIYSFLGLEYDVLLETNLVPDFFTSKVTGIEMLYQIADDETPNTPETEEEKHNYPWDLCKGSNNEDTSLDWAEEGLLFCDPMLGSSQDFPEDLLSLNDVFNADDEKIVLFESF